MAEGGDLRAALQKWEAAAALDPVNGMLHELRAQVGKNATLPQKLGPLQPVLAVYVLR